MSEDTEEKDKSRRGYIERKLLLNREEVRYKRDAERRRKNRDEMR